jgi:sterol 3beta-glucosyltransferase
MYAYSPTVVPRPDDWPENAVVTGFWFLDEEDTRERDDELVAFLEGGDPPVYIGFGSAVATDPKRLTEAAIGALHECGLRGVIATGLGGLQSVVSSDAVLTLKDAPHGWLFPKVAAVVHHGGAGTTAVGLREGRPTVVCPFTGDQSFWGDRVARLGAGPAPIPQKKLNSTNLAAAIRLAHSDSVRRRSAEVARSIQAEDGIGHAVTFVELVADSA